MDTSKTYGNSNGILEVIKAVVIAVLISLVLVLISAFALKIFNIDNYYIPIINQVIKGVSILIACLVSMRGATNGWVKGLFVGILYVALGFVVFSFLDGEFKWGLSLLNDIAVGSISGLLSGIICANIRTK